eukprot:gene28501-31657_t
MTRDQQNQNKSATGGDDDWGSESFAPHSHALLPRSLADAVSIPGPNQGVMPRANMPSYQLVSGGSGHATGNAPATHLYVGVPELSRGNLTNAPAYLVKQEPAPPSRGQLGNQANPLGQRLLLGNPILGGGQNTLFRGNSSNQFVSSQPAYAPDMLQQHAMVAPQEYMGGQYYWQQVPWNLPPGASSGVPNPQPGIFYQNVMAPVNMMFPGTGAFVASPCPLPLGNLISQPGNVMSQPGIVMSQQGNVMGQQTSASGSLPSSDRPLSMDDGVMRAIKKQRLYWTPELHRHFERAIEKLGASKARPKNIVELMNVEGLTRENVSSHLQKYRVQQKEEQENNNREDGGG